MNRVLITAEEVPLPPWTPSLTKYARKVLAALGRDKWDLSILLCGDKTIKKLNSRYRGKKEATDVLSFAYGDSQGNDRLAGDLAISLDTLGGNARRFKVSKDEELRRLLIHGILHIDGMDHKTNKKTEIMLQLQEKILTDIKGHIGEDRV